MTKKVYNSSILIRFCIALFIGIVIGASILLFFISSKQEGQIQIINIESVSSFVSSLGVLVTIVLAILAIDAFSSLSDLKNAMSYINNNKEELEKVIKSHETTILQSMEIQVGLASMSKNIDLKNKVAIDRARLYYTLSHLSRTNKLPLIYYIANQGEISDINRLEYMKAKCDDEIEIGVLDDAISQLRRKYAI